MSRMGHLVSNFSSASSVPYGTKIYRNYLFPSMNRWAMGIFPFGERKYLQIKDCFVLQYEQFDL